MFLFFPKFTIHLNREVEEELKKESFRCARDQQPPTPSSGEKGADEEGGVKATIGGGEGEWAQKWGCNDDSGEYGADKVALATQTIQQSTIRR